MVMQTGPAQVHPVAGQMMVCLQAAHRMHQEVERGLFQ